MRKDGWHAFTWLDGLPWLDDLELQGVRSYEIRQDTNEPIRLVLELFVNPEPSDEVKLRIADKILAKK